MKDRFFPKQTNVEIEISLKSTGLFIWLANKPQHNGCIKVFILGVELNLFIISDNGTTFACFITNSDVWVYFINQNIPKL